MISNESSSSALNETPLKQEWASRPYVISIEVGLRSPGGPLQDVVDWMKVHRPDLGMGFFGALGEGSGRVDDHGRRYCMYEKWVDRSSYCSWESPSHQT